MSILVKEEGLDSAFDYRLANEYRNSLFLTAYKLLGYRDITWYTHRKMIEALESPKRRKLIVMPRGTFKSTIGVVAFSIWSLIRNPNERILIDSEVWTNSSTFLREIKAHLDRRELTDLYGIFKTDRNWNEGEITIAQRSHTYKESSITIGSIGSTKIGQHYTIIIGDDYNSGNNSQTQEGCAKVVTHYRMNQAILEPGGLYVLIGTRYSENDIIGHVMTNEINSKGIMSND